MWSAAQDRMPCGCAGCGSHTGCDHPDAAVLLFARMLIGLAIGADSAIATSYIAE
jgi:MFS family permease